MAEGRVVLGVFVGGASRRMGGRPKGLLPGPSGEPLVEGLVRAGREAGLEAVLVGDAAAYASVVPEVPRLADRPPGVGPLGGLAALLHHAGDADAIAVACDMPHVSAAVLTRLAAHPSAAAVIAPERDGRFEPLLARYRAGRVGPDVDRAIAEGVRSFQELFGRLDVERLALDVDLERALVDWDTPDDVTSEPRS